MPKGNSGIKRSGGRGKGITEKTEKIEPKAQTNSGEVKTLEQGIKEFREAMREASYNKTRDDDFVHMARLRKELQDKRGWTSEEVDNMITYLIYEGGLDWIATERGKYKESDFYYGMDGVRVGMLRWLPEEQNYYYGRE